MNMSQQLESDSGTSRIDDVVRTETVIETESKEITEHIWKIKYIF